MKPRITFGFVIFVCLIFVFSSCGTSVYLMGQSGVTQHLAVPPVLDLMEQVNSSLLEHWIQTIEDFGPHPTGSVELDLLGEYLYYELSLMNVSVENHSWSSGERSGVNIVATQLGGGSDNVVIVCAHYDSIGISPGADDDGSGIASVLMLAEILDGYSFSSTIRYILFSGEEQGLLGSKEYVKDVIANNDRIVGVLALDKIGYAETIFDGGVVRHHADPGSAWMIRMSQSIADQYYDAIGLEVEGYPFDGSSDHKAFVDQGFMGSNFMENFLNPQYHTSEDRLEFMNMSYLAKICRLSLGMVVSLAEFDPLLDNSDLSIKILGPRHAEKCQFSVIVENQKYMEDTANVTINISMRYLFRDEYVSLIKDFYTNPATWEFEREVGEQWDFKVSGRRYGRGLFRFEIRVEGFDDDVNLAVSEQTVGVILGPTSLFLVSKF